MIAPTLSEEERRAFAEDIRQIISAENAARIHHAIDQIDITGLLTNVAAPCLVLHCRGDRLQPIEQGRAMAAGLRNAEFVAYDSPNHVPPETDPVWPLIERDVHAFLGRHAK